MSRNSWIVICCSIIFGVLLTIFLLPSDKFDLPPVKPGKSFREPDLPDFEVYKKVKERKSVFLAFILQFVEKENQRIAVLRESVVRLAENPNALTHKEQNWLQLLAKYYRVKTDGRTNEELLSRLLDKVDQVPPSLALAQSASESAWGRSRFAIEGNNLFGQWCFSAGCGIVPGERLGGASHEVATFSSPRQSVEAYIRNLNSNKVYAELRQIRAQLRQNQQPLSGYELTIGLNKYSERGDAYVDELRKLMRVNKLSRFDNAAESIVAQKNIPQPIASPQSIAPKEVNTNINE